MLIASDRVVREGNGDRRGLEAERQTHLMGKHLSALCLQSVTPLSPFDVIFPD